MSLPALCDSCGTLLSDSVCERQGHPLPWGFREEIVYVATAARGCTRCILILACIHQYCNATFIATDTIDYVCAAAWPLLVIRENTPSSAQTETKRYSELQVFREQGTGKFWRDSLSPSVADPSPVDEKDGLSASKRFPGHTSSNGTFASISSWIQECLNSHDRCNQGLNAPTMGSPTRLLSLRGNTVALREGVVSRRYACLSHSWGTGEDMPKLKHDNIKNLCSEVPWGFLSRTFQNAIDICRRIDIPYLWIDALCIVQDDEDDWRIHAGHMASIYENSFITIAATKSSNSSGGVFSETNLEHVSSSVSGYPGVFVRKSIPAWPKTWTHALDIASWPLLSRGWVYQELRLSKRILHYCAQELIWQCQCQRWSESGCNDETIYPDPRTPAINGTQENFGNAIDYLRNSYQKLEQHPILLWYRTVEEYSQRELTFYKDKMAALAALTQRMDALRVNDAYILGLWRDTFVSDLLWFTHDRRSKPKGHGYPSWSWASVQSKVQWDQVATASRCLPWSKSPVFSLDTLIEPGKLRSYLGMHAPAPLHIEGHLIDFSPFISQTLDFRDVAPLAVGIGRSRKKPTVEESRKARAKMLACKPGLGSLILWEFSVDCLEDNDLLCKPEDTGKYVGIYLLPLLCDTANVTGLVLRRKTTDGAYERVGLARLGHVWTVSKRYQLNFPVLESMAAFMDEHLAGLPRQNITLE